MIRGGNASIGYLLDVFFWISGIGSGQFSSTATATFATNEGLGSDSYPFGSSIWNLFGIGIRALIHPSSFDFFKASFAST